MQESNHEHQQSRSASAWPSQLAAGLMLTCPCILMSLLSTSASSCCCCFRRLHRASSSIPGTPPAGISLGSEVHSGAEAGSEVGCSQT